MDGFKNTAELASECNSQYRVLKEHREEQERMELERREEQKRIELERAKQERIEHRFSRQF